jgi:hypothetical protein
LASHIHNSQDWAKNNRETSQSSPLSYSQCHIVPPKSPQISTAANAPHNVVDGTAMATYIYHQLLNDANVVDLIKMGMA